MSTTDTTILKTALKGLMATDALTTPCTYYVNILARNADTKLQQRAALLLTYLSRPVDRIIQALLLPTWMVIYHFYSLLLDQPDDIKFYKVLTFFPSLHIGLHVGFAAAAYKLADAAVQVFIPYQTGYALAKGSLAPREYFYLRSLSEGVAGSINVLPADSISKTMGEPGKDININSNILWFFYG